MYSLPAFREVFDLFDCNGGGTIDAEELDATLRSVDINLNGEELREILKALDRDGKKKQLELGFQGFD